MADRCAPYISAAWESGVDRMSVETGLDESVLRIEPNKARQAVSGLSLAFSAATNATTALAITAARDAVRKSIEETVLDAGQGVPALAKKINEIYSSLSKSHARTIAQTEINRSFHAAQDMAARDSGAVVGWEWLLSDDACLICFAIRDQVGRVKIGQPFAKLSDHPDYGTVQHPPAHPRCNCSITAVLDPALTGEPEPQWGRTADLRNDPGGQAEPEPTATPTPSQAQSQDRFGPSAATVSNGAPNRSGRVFTVEEAVAEAGKILGRDITPQDLASLVGAPDDAKVTIKHVKDGRVWIETKGDGWKTERVLWTDDKGKPVLTNGIFTIEDTSKRGGDLALRIFGRQIENGAKLGLDRIEATAAGWAPRHGPSLYNGYYTWARFGYDSQLKDLEWSKGDGQAAKKELKAKFPKAKTIHDLMSTPEGREWWKANGQEFDATFDLKLGSKSLKVWEGYLAERQAQGRGIAPPAAPAKPATPSIAPSPIPTPAPPPVPAPAKPRPLAQWSELRGQSPEQASATLSPRLAPASPVKVAGMSQSQPMPSLKVGEWVVFAHRWDAASAPAGDLVTIAEHIEKMPPRLRAATKAIIYTDQPNAQDEVWRQRYGYDETKQTRATSGGGAIVVYRDKPLGTVYLTHEAGHNLASTLYGGKPIPPPESDFAKAASKENPPPTKYAGKAIGEDFAESVRLYVDDPAAFAKSHPQRHAVIHKVMTDPNYGG